jgi:hypothetical protein
LPPGQAQYKLIGAPHASSKDFRIFERHDAPAFMSASENVRMPPYLNEWRSHCHKFGEPLRITMTVADEHHPKIILPNCGRVSPSVRNEGAMSGAV